MSPKKMEFGPKGRFQRLSPNSLHIDKSYQRTTNMMRARRIAKDFFWPAFGVVLVAKRAGSFHVMDGGHRVAAARLLKLDKVPCLVFAFEDLPQKARTFVIFNTTGVRISGPSLWKALQESEDAEAMAAQLTMAQYNFKMTTARGSANGFKATRAAASIMRMHKDDVLADSLHILTACWPKSELLGKSHILRGIAKFVLECRTAEAAIDASAMKRLRKVSLESINDKALSASRLSQESRVWAFNEILRDLYNKGLRSSRRI